MEKRDPIEEALRYVDNAKEVIKKANYDEELKMYTDSKYIKMAGNTLWNGCLIALEAVLQIRNGKGRPSNEKYQEAAAKRDRKLLAFVNNGYETMHLVMGYDGNKNKKCAMLALNQHLRLFPAAKFCTKDRHWFHRHNRFRNGPVFLFLAVW